MKNCLLMVALACVASAGAETVGGPRGGRLLEGAGTRAEFLVNTNRNIEIRFYDAALAPVAPGEQVAGATAETPSGKVPLEFARAGDALVSTAALPEDDGYQVVVWIAPAPGAKARTFRIPLRLETCGECNRAEYACICDHAGGDARGHSH